ncbi:silent information regulator protein Sir2 [Arthrobacter agilis]|nr:silent information regulator protein Sir2 [Arthrobacter agilis]
MFGFDEETFLAQHESTIALREDIEKALLTAQERGFTNLFLVGAGGTYANMLAHEEFVRRRSSFPVRAVIASEFVLTSDSRFGSDSVAIFTSASGTTEDTLAAVVFAKEKGALTIGLTGYPDSPLAQATDIALITAPKAWPFDVQLLLFTAKLLSTRGEFDDYEKLAEELKLLPGLLLKVAAQADPLAEEFARKHRATDYHFLVGSGNVWGLTYLYSMCVLEEMQWLRTTRVHASEFFHGSLELIEEDTSMILFFGEDETRPLMERVRRFAEKYSNDVNVFDSADYPLEGISPEFRSLLSPVVLDTVTDRISKHLARERDHSLDIRRYYRVVEY